MVTCTHSYSYSYSLPPGSHPGDGSLAAAVGAVVPRKVVEMKVFAEVFLGRAGLVPVGCILWRVFRGSVKSEYGEHNKTGDL